MRSVMQHRFSQVANVNAPRSTFNRSHGHKTTFDAGLLIPFFHDIEIYPGDSCAVSVNGFARLATPTYPIMDNMTMTTFFFGCPMRLLWDNFPKMMGEQHDPGDSIDYTVPQTVGNDMGNETLWDYFGLPTKIAHNISVNALPFRCHNFIWSQWFRDQNLQDSADFSTGDGPDTYATYWTNHSDGLFRRGKRHDYFTSCLPWPQKGDAVTLSLGTEAPIFGDNMDFDGVDDSANYAQIRDAKGSSANLRTLVVGNPGTQILYGNNSSNGTGEMKTDLTTATASTINELREAEHVQRLLERSARGGTRFPEIIKSHFNVTHPDVNWRPTYLGGGSTPVIVRPVARTDSSPGVLGGMGVAAFKNHGFTQSFSEWSIVIGYVCVDADLTYQEGIDRSWSLSSRYDFYHPVLANLGETGVLNQEIFVDAATLAAGTNDDVFGYQEAWAWLRYKKSLVTGKFRSNDAASLDAWHLSEEFGSTPTLGDSFIRSDPPVDRTIAVPSEPHFIFDSFINYRHTRVLPVYSIPSLSSRF